MANDISSPATQLGEYEVLVNGTAAAFWPLDPLLSLAEETSPLVCAPASAGSVNTAIIPIFGVFDVVISFTDDVISSTCEAPTLLTRVEGRAAAKKMPLVEQSPHSARIRFAVDHVDVAVGGYWSGMLVLSANYKQGSATKVCHLRAQLKIARSGTIANLFVFYVVHETPKLRYAWITAKTVDAADSQPRPSVAVYLKVLRDNESGYTEINRRVSLTSIDDGLVSGADQRSIIAVPVEWPLIFTATRPGYVTRGHMIREPQANATADNLSPHDVGPIRLTALPNASLSGRKFLLDPGHGVAYALHSQCRSEEWFFAHKLADRIAAVLMQDHGVIDTDIIWTKTAGFGLIDPRHVRNKDDLPTNGNARYTIDLPARQIAVKAAGIELHEVSALLLTTHEPERDAPLPISNGDRTNFLTRNQATITSIESRLNASLAASQRRIRPHSIRWDSDSQHYVFTKERRNAQGGWNIENEAVHLPITAADKFALDGDALRVLADRTARWSLAAELGTGKAHSGIPAYDPTIRSTMRAAGFLEYARDKILLEVGLPNLGPLTARAGSTQGWAPHDRTPYFNNHGTVDMFLSLHANSENGKGGQAILSGHGGADAAPDEQVRIGKVLLKYLDGFDQGLHKGGLNKEGRPAGMLLAGNTMRNKYAYIETEFMDAIDPTDNSRYTYQSMIEDDFLDKLAHQIVCGVVEWLIDKQVDLDAVHFKNEASNLW